MITEAATVAPMKDGPDGGMGTPEVLSGGDVPGPPEYTGVKLNPAASYGQRLFTTKNRLCMPVNRGLFTMVNRPCFRRCLETRRELLFAIKK